MSFSVTILGSSAATPTSKRNASALLINMDFTYFLVDCGEGTQIQLRKFKIKLQRIKHIFISHLHGDHFFGLIGLISTFHLLGRKTELHIYGPPELKGILDIQLKASQTELIYQLIFHETQAKNNEILFETDDHIITSFPLDHRIATTGFLFAEKRKPKKIDKTFLLDELVLVQEILKIKQGADFTSPSGKFYSNDEITINPPEPRSFAYCSDTKYFEQVIDVIKDTDLLYHEATFMEDMKNVAEEKYHSTAREAATIAKKSNVGKLIIGHFSARYRDLDKMLDEASKVFPNSFLAEDGDIYEIDQIVEVSPNEKTRL